MNEPADIEAVPDPDFEFVLSQGEFLKGVFLRWKAEKERQLEKGGTWTFGNFSIDEASRIVERFEGLANARMRLDLLTTVLGTVNKIERTSPDHPYSASLKEAAQVLSVAVAEMGYFLVWVLEAEQSLNREGYRFDGRTVVANESIRGRPKTLFRAEVEAVFRLLDLGRAPGKGNTMETREDIRRKLEGFWPPDPLNDRNLQEILRDVTKQERALRRGRPTP